MILYVAPLPSSAAADWRSFCRRQQNDPRRNVFAIHHLCDGDHFGDVNEMVSIRGGPQLPNLSFFENVAEGPKPRQGRRSIAQEFIPADPIP